MANPIVAAMARARAAQQATEQPTVAYLWPCNQRAWDLWCGLQTQWQVADGRRTGLNKAGVRAHLDEHGLCGPERTQIYASICAAEHATLDAWADIAAKKAS